MFGYEHTKSVKEVLKALGDCMLNICCYEGKLSFTKECGERRDF